MILWIMRFLAAKPNDRGKTMPMAQSCELTCKDEPNKTKDELWNQHQRDINRGVVCASLTPEILDDDVTRTRQDITCKDTKINPIAMTENGCDGRTDWDADKRDNKAKNDIKQQLRTST